MSVYVHVCVCVCVYCACVHVCAGRGQGYPPGQSCHLPARQHQSANGLSHSHQHAAAPVVVLHGSNEDVQYQYKRSLAREP